MTTETVVTLLFSGVVTACTVVNAVLTRRLVHETRDLRMAQAEPYVCVYLALNSKGFQLIDLIVENCGTGPAHNVEFDARMVAGMASSDDPDITILKSLNGIQYLARGQRIVSSYGSAIDLFKHPERHKISVAVTYADTFRRRHSHYFVLDAAMFEGLTMVDIDPIGDAAKALQSAARSLDKLASGEVSVVTEDWNHRANRKLRGPAAGDPSIPA